MVQSPQEVIVKTALSFLRRELSVFPEFIGKGGGISGGRSRFCGFATVALVVGGFLGIGIVISGSRVSVVGLMIVIGFGVVYSCWSGTFRGVVPSVGNRLHERESS